jgi:hypothetical protein
MATRYAIGGFESVSTGSRIYLKRKFTDQLTYRLCRDTSLLHAVWQTFDEDRDGKSSIYGDLVSAIRQIISEKPGELGINEMMQGLGISHLAVDHSGRQGGYLDMGLNAVSSAATAGVSTVSAMIGTEGEGRLDATCGVKVQW